MNIMFTGLISLAVGIWVLSRTRHWFFESEAEYWQAASDGFRPRLFDGKFQKRYVHYLFERKGRLNYVSWLMPGTISSLLVYAPINLLPF